MSVRKRTWTTTHGKAKTAFVVDYFDGAGKRRHESFATESEAKRRYAQVVLDISKGTASVSRRMTLGAAAEKWRAHLESEDRERATLAQYEQHLRLHILPVLGRKKLSELNLETVQSFRKFLLAEDEKGTPVRSRALAAKIWITFKSLLKHGRVAYLAQGVSGITPNKRGKRKLEIGVDVPTNEEVKRLYLATAGNAPGQKRKRALLLVAAFCGLRASELRGLRWADVKLDEGELQVTQRADRYNVIGHPKSESSRRTVPLSPDVVHALREWKVAQGGFDLVFSNKRGSIESHGNMLRSLKPVMRAAALVRKDGKSRYALHDFRHYFASWVISPRDRGGRGLSPKIAQEWLGHSSIAMTLDVYGHLFKEVDQTELAASTASVLG
jgi:integrase